MYVTSSSLSSVGLIQPIGCTFPLNHKLRLNHETFRISIPFPPKGSKAHFLQTLEAARGVAECSWSCPLLVTPPMRHSPKGISMKSRVTLDTAMKVTRMASASVASWPLTSDASHATVLKRDIYWWIATIHNLTIASFMVYDVFRSYSHDMEHAIIVSAEFTAQMMTVVTMVLSRIEGTRLQGLLAELQSFVKRANKEELDLIQTYVDKCLCFHTLILSVTICGPLAFIFGAIVTKQYLPAESEYPYRMESTWLLAVTFLSQVIIIVQAASTVIFDFMFAILLWYIGARIEMLATQLQRATTHKDVKRCIRKHQYLLEYVERLKTPVRVIVSEAISLTTLSVITGGLVLMRGPAAFVVIKFCIFELVAVLRLFVYSWPADNLMDKSERIAVAAFDCKWIGKSPGMTKDLLFIMHKAQTPMAIDLPGITPALTLEFYTSVTKMTFSYLTTLHAMVDN